MKPEPVSTEPDGRIAKLEHEVAKLQKINAALMDRVERSMDLEGSGFALFETAILLERKVQERTAALEKALDELHRTNAMLEQAKADADRANAGKTHFFAAASHDLLQLLNAVRLFVSALAETEQSAYNRDLIENVENAFDSVERLLGALLDISKLDAGVLVPEIAVVPIATLLQPLAKEFRPLAEERGLELRVVSTHAMVRTDPHLLVRMLRNLLSNAVRYTRQGRILLGCRRADGGLRLEIHDTGIGIPEDKFSEIFEEFRRLRVQREGRDRGFGLGLAIVQRIARMLGHRVHVSSSLGRGTCFSVDLPLGEWRSIPKSGRHKAKPAHHDLRGALVLVIEDEDSVRNAMRALLEAWGCEVATTATAEEFLQGGGDVLPDLVIADYHLEDGMLGSDAIAAIRIRLQHPVPALVITADHSPKVLEQLRTLGIPMLPKPVPPAKLRSLASHLIVSGTLGRNSYA